MPPDRVYRVEHVVLIDGAKLYAVTDMIFNGEQANSGSNLGR